MLITLQGKLAGILDDGWVDEDRCVISNVAEIPDPTLSLPYRSATLIGIRSYYRL